MTKKIDIRLSILLLSLFSLALISCGSKKTVNDATNTDQVITEKYWKLITLEGQDITMAENQEREAFFMLKANDNTVNGFAGCNNIMGEFKLQEGNRIRFNNMGTTLRLCPDVDVNESEFLTVFELADNYTIHNDTLALNVGRRMPLALFVAVYF